MSNEFGDKRAPGMGSNYSGKEGRGVSPTFAGVGNTEGKRTAISPSEVRNPNRPGSYTGGSTILADRRYKTPMEKPVAFSTIN
jgi:hypothetical protein